MAIARASQIHLDFTRYYHYMPRCVRRIFLCGEDSHCGKISTTEKTGYSIA